MKRNLSTRLYCLLFACLFFLASATIPTTWAQDRPRPPDNSNDPAPKVALIRDHGISADGKFAFAGDAERTIWVWNIAERKLVRTIRDPLKNRNTLPCYAFSRDGKFAVVGNQDGFQRPGWGIAPPDPESLTLWDLMAGVKIRSFEMRNESVEAVALSPDGKLALSVSVWKKIPRELPPNFESTWFGRFTALYALKVWDTSNGKRVQTLCELGEFGPLAFSTDGKFIVSLLVGPRPPFNEPLTWALRKWDTRRWEDLGAKSIDPVASSFLGLSSIALSPDSKYLAAAGGASVSFWNLETGKRVWEHNCINQCQILRNGAVSGWWQISSVASSSDGNLLVASGPGTRGLLGTEAGNGPGGFFVLDAKTGKRMPDFGDTNGWAASVSFTPDGTMLVGASAEGLRFSDAKTGKRLFTLNH
jgi:WD40 repeat protein